VVLPILARTWRFFDPSTAWLARVAAAGLPQHDTSPEISKELGKFLGHWHGLVHVGDEVGKFR